LKEARPLRKAILELTRACNMNCIHCASAAGKVRPDELSNDKFSIIIDEANEMGAGDIIFSGGEPLLRVGWDKLGKKVREYGMRLGMVTNGTYVMKYIDEIEEYVSGLTISLDGLEETHNYYRQDNSSFKTVIGDFKELAKRDVIRFASTSISKLNINQLEDMYKLLIDLEVIGWQVHLTFPSGRMKEHRELLVEPKDLCYITDFLAKVRGEALIDLHVGDNIGYHTAVDPLMRGFHWDGCLAGQSVVSVEADGTVKGCLCQLPELMPDKDFVEGNVKNRSLRDIWYDKELFSYNRNFDFNKVQGFCASCKYLKRCKCGCPAFAYYMTGNRYNNPYCIYRVQSTLM
jgi:radical SAM protein with 4Fe4S-binding SPASM domain